MLPVYVDFNSRERYDDGGEAVYIGFRGNPTELKEKLEPGATVLLYDEGLSYQAVLRQVDWLDGWIADLIDGTGKDLTVAEFERLDIANKKAAL